MSPMTLASVEISDEGYAPLTGLQQDTSLATFTADEESYVVLYAYTAQVITLYSFIYISCLIRCNWTRN